MKEYFDYLGTLKTNPEIDSWIAYGSKRCQEMSINSEEEFDEQGYLVNFENNEFFSSSKIENEELQRKSHELRGKLEDAKAELRIEKSRNKDLRTAVTQREKLIEKKKGLFSNEFAYGKIPPQNVRLEEIVLGSYIKNPKLMENFNQPYLHEMFYRDEHKTIHKSMMDVQGKLSSANLITDLIKKTILDEVGGPYFIEKNLLESEVTDNSDLIKSYLEEIEQDYLAREVIRFSNELSNKMFDYDKGEPMSEVIRKKSAEMLELLPFQHRKSYDKKSAIFEAKEELKKLKEKNGFPKISTGYGKLDRVTHGLPKGKMFIFGARGKIGKTALTTSIGEEVADQGYDVAYFSHEVKMNEMINRLASRRTGIDLRRFEYNPEGFTLEEENKLEKAFEEIENSNFHLEYGRAPSLDYIVSRSKQYKAMHPNLALIVFDGLQAYENLVPERGNKSDFFTKIMSTMKYDIAEQLGVTVLLNAQLKSDVDTRYKKTLCKPRSTEDFSDCKGIKDICDGAFGLWRGEYYLPDNKNYKNKLKIIPLDLRNEDKHIKPFDLGIDIKTMNVYEI